MRALLLAFIFMLPIHSLWACPEGAEAIGKVINRFQDGGTPPPRIELPGSGTFEAGDVFRPASKIDDIQANAEVMVKRGGDKGWTRGTYAGKDENGFLLVNFTENGVAKTKPVAPGNFQTNIKVFQESESLLQPGRQVFVTRGGGGVSVGTITKYDESGKMRVDFFDEKSGGWAHKFVSPENFSKNLKPVTKQFNLRLQTGESVDVFSRTEGAYRSGAITSVDDSGNVNVLYTFNDGTTATKKIPASEIDNYLRPPKLAMDDAIFRGSPTHAQSTDGVFMAGRKLPNGETRRIMYNAGDREFAKANGKLFEGVSPKDLPVGNSYTYIVKEDGSMVFGLVEDGWEFGVKHAHLANGERVVAAGEISIKGPGNFSWNLESGSFTRKLVESGKTNMAILQDKMSRLFNSRMGSAGSYSDEILLNSGPPNPTNLKKLCGSPLFNMLNKGVCETLGL